MIPTLVQLHVDTQASDTSMKITKGFYTVKRRKQKKLQM